MARKYTRDYRMIDSLDERGRVRTETEYTGDYYAYADAAGAAGTLRRMLVFGLMAAAAFLIPLLLRSSGMLTLYVTLPYVFAILPLWLLISALWELRRAGDRLDHRRADLVNERLPGATLWLLILPGAALLGELAALLIARKPFLFGDGAFLLCDAAVLCCGAVCFRLRRKLRAEKAE